MMSGKMYRFRVAAEHADARYVEAFLQTEQARQAIDKMKTGSSDSGLNLTHARFRQLPVPVAPLPEQRRIVAEIEKQFTRLEAGVAALRRVQANLKRYRAAVLKAACEGKLVPTEAELAREGKADANFETGEELLARILRQRRKNWQGRGKYKEPAAPDTAALPEIPEGWTWARLEQLCLIFGGLTKHPKRAKLPKKFPYLRVANVYANELRLEDIEYIGVEDSELAKLLVHADDLLIVEGNGSKAQIGRLAIWNGSIDPCVHQNHLIKVRPVESRMPKWILHWLQSSIGRHFVELVASSTSGLYTLSVNKVGDLPVALPPLAEQTRIVAEAERRLSVLDELEASVSLNLQRAARLRQSILQQAFSGGLGERRTLRSKLESPCRRSPPIAVNPSLLAWAREESGYPLERVAKRLNVKEERLAAWESGELQPTMRQVENLARFLHRPLSVFFMPRPPKLAPLATEYRRLPDVEPGHESPELRLALRQMLTRRENALNLMEELGEPIPPFSLRAHLRESPIEVGRRLRETTGLGVAAQLKWAGEYEAWRAWRAAVERLGVLVFVFAKVPLKEARGLALLRRPMPVAAVNGKEGPESKPFTLLHEVVHLMLAAGDEEAPAASEARRGKEWEEVERFAEVAASHALVPEDALREVIGRLGLDDEAWDIPNVRRVAKKFRITPLAAATRLRESGFMSWAEYRAWRREWEEYVATLPPRSGGFATPAEKALNRAGRPFAQLVLEALSANRITSVDAARYLDLKFEHFESLQNNLSAGPGSA
jgi:restriction endonuclease S subunit/Zn-dependent peptidase ImmA (M78 family)/transcriptional regulator with XRE-family HTH domain